MTDKKAFLIIDNDLFKVITIPNLVSTISLPVIEYFEFKPEGYVPSKIYAMMFELSLPYFNYGIYEFKGIKRE